MYRVFVVLCFRRDLASGKYRTLRQFSDEVMRLFSNCETYNGPDSEFTAEAIRQRKAFQKHLSQLQQELSQTSAATKRRRVEPAQEQQSDSDSSSRDNDSAPPKRLSRSSGNRRSLKESRSEEDEEEDAEGSSSDESGRGRRGRPPRQGQRDATKRSRRGSSDGEQRSGDVHGIMEELYSNLVAEDSEGIFAEPVTDDVAPGYSQEISRPTDLKKIR